MKATELFVLMPDTLGLEILEYTHTTDRELYTAIVDMVAQAKKVRPVFIQRQPRKSRFTMLIGAMGRPTMEMAAENLIRNWLLKKHTTLLTDFLDGLSIKHEKGVVETLPDTVPDDILRATLENILSRYDHNVVAVYLHAFNHMNETGWANLDHTLHNDDRLQFHAAPA